MKQMTFSIGRVLQLTLETEPPRFGLAPDELFGLALRDNPNRAFLFVSRVLGKHIPIHPIGLPTAGRLISLAMEGAPDTEAEGWLRVLNGEDEATFPELMERLGRERIFIPPEESTLFIGFAETATGLGRAVADCYTGACAYVSTTRLDIGASNPLTFEESHSHARTHLLHLSDAEKYKRVVIIDDEFTTGRTALRLAEMLHKKYGIKRFILLSLLDWTDGSERSALEERTGAEIKQVSLLHGRVAEAIRTGIPGNGLDDWRGKACPPAHIREASHGIPMGRTPLMPDALEKSRRFCKGLAEELGRADLDTLFLGTGELIYEPMLIAGYCGAQAFHSSTQSPIYAIPGTATESGVHFDPAEQYSGAGYLYNVPEGKYRKAFIFAEAKAFRREGLDQLADWLHGRGCEMVEVVAL